MKFFNTESKQVEAALHIWPEHFYYALSLALYYSSVKSSTHTGFVGFYHSCSGNRTKLHNVIARQSSQSLSLLGTAQRHSWKEKLVQQIKSKWAGREVVFIEYIQSSCSCYVCVFP